MVWSTETGKPVGQPFTGHREAGSQTPVYCAAFSPDGLLVASGGLDNRILLWEPAAIEPFDFAAAVAGGSVPPPAMKALEGHKAAVRGLVFSGDGKRLLSGGQDNLLIVWDLESLRAVKSLRGHDGWVRSCRLVQGDTSAVSGSHDGMVKFWDIAGYQESRVLQARTLDLHADAVLHAAFSSDSRGVVTASRDRTAIRWDATTGTALMHFRQGHDLTTTRAVFFPDGERLLTTAIDNTARVWDVITGAELLSLRMPRTGLQGAAAISRDGKWIVTGSDRLRIQDQEDAWAVQVFDAATGQCVHRLAEHRAPVSAVACSPDGQYVFSGDVQGAGILWDRESGRRVFEIHEDIQITAVAFSPEGTRLWVANNYNAVRSWSVPEGNEMVGETFLHPAGVASMSLSADGRRMLTSCRDGHVRLWEVADQQLIRDLELRGGPATMAQNLRFAMKQMNIDEPRLSESCEVPLAILRGLLAQRVDPTEDVVAKLAAALETTSEALWRFVPEVAISPDGTQAITISATDRIVRLWSLPDGVEQRFPSEDQRPGPLLDLARGAHRGLVWTAVFSPDGQRVATVGGDSARLWNLARDVSESQREMMAFSPHGAVAWAEFSPDERWIATGSWDTSARIWDAATGQVIAQLGRTAEAPDRGHQGRVNSVCFSSDGQRLVTASDDGTACLWDCRDWSLLGTLRGHAGGVVCAVFSPDAQQVLTCSRDKTARLWDAHSGIEQAVLRGHQWSVLQGAFSPDGRWIATAGADNTAILWRLDPEHPPEIARRLIGHTAAVTSVAFSPGDPTMRILTGSEDYSAILWDVDTGRELLSLKGHTREVTSVAFSPDGSNVLTASRDGTAIVWLAMPRSGGEDLAEAERDRTVEPR
jgi:WD40 repeat protein